MRWCVLALCGLPICGHFVCRRLPEGDLEASLREVIYDEMVSAHRELYANISSMDSNDNDERDARPRAPLPDGAVNNRTRVAVGISGQLRSFGRTWRSLLKTVIEPTLAEGYELAIFAAVATAGESSARLADDHAALGAFHVALARVGVPLELRVESADAEDSELRCEARATPFCARILCSVSRLAALMREFVF